jgi:large subunit ribosomal protein L24
MVNRVKKFKKDDNVIIIAGKDKGKKGKIVKVLHKNNRILVSGINIAIVHQKPKANMPGQRTKIEKPVHMSNISHIENNKSVKIKFEGKGKDKVRFSKKTKEKIG